MPAALRSELASLLAETPEAARARRASTFDRLSGDRSGRMVLFGAGALGRSVLSGLRTCGIEPAAFADNDAALQGTRIDGLPVLPPSDAARELGEDHVFVIATMRGCVEGPPAAQVRAQLAALGADAVVPVGYLFWKLPEAFLPYYFVGDPAAVVADADRVMSAYDLMADDRSREEYVAHVRCRLTLEYRGTPPEPIHDIYFPSDLFALGDDEVFVDCGAFDGDAIRRLIAQKGGAIGGVVAFEPDPGTFEHLTAYVGSLAPALARSVTLVPAAVGATSGTVSFAATGDVQSAVRADGDMAVRSVRLDDEPHAAEATYIKMDIEGGEADALVGARAIIRDRSPLLAISAYHRPEDVWELPLLVRGMNEGYRFHLRPYMEACWDTVCYAIPERRDQR